VDHAERPVRSEDPAELALATVDQAFPGESEAERRTLCSALEAAAVPHWCDGAVLTALVDDSGLLGQNLWDHLKTLPVIEGFPARPGAAGYVAEISRLALRKRLAETQRARFIDLNRRMVRLLAADTRAADTRAADRIEWIYHLLVADAEQGVAELAELNRRWMAEGRQEDREALAQVLTELDDAGLSTAGPRRGRASSRLSAAPTSAGLPASAMRHTRSSRWPRSPAIRGSSRMRSRSWATSWRLAATWSRLSMRTGRR